MRVGPVRPTPVHSYEPNAHCTSVISPSMLPEESITPTTSKNSSWLPQLSSMTHAISPETAPSLSTSSQISPSHS